MRRQMMTLAWVVVLVTALAAPGLAGLLVDTGGVALPPSGATALRTYNWVAGEFTLPQDSTLTAIYGWIGTSAEGTMRAAIRQDNGDVPGSVIFSATAYAGSGGDAYGYAWRGPSGLSKFLAAGTYWVSIEVPDGTNFYGAMDYSAPNYLANAAWTGNQGSSWTGDDYNLRVGYRIEGVAVPLPAAVWLFGGGLVGLLGLGRKRGR